jgi:hypothetical protein
MEDHVDSRECIQRAHAKRVFCFRDRIIEPPGSNENKSTHGASESPIWMCIERGMDLLQGLVLMA